MILDTRSHAAFRDHARAWLTLIPHYGVGSTRAVELGSQRALVGEGVLCRDGMSVESLILARGDFHAGNGCRFQSPVYVSGNCHFGKNCQLDAITVEGYLILGPNSRVRRWAESGRTMDLRSGSFAGQAAIAGRSLQVGIDAGATVLTAPEIATTGRMVDCGDMPPVQQSIVIGPPSTGELPPLGWVRGFKIEKLIPLGAETWAYDGSLQFPAPVYLRSKLVVRGSFSCPPGSMLEDDVKSGDSLRVGRGSICKGILTARGEMVLERDCLFEGDLIGDRTIRLSSGVRGLRAPGLVRVSARQGLILEPNVVVRGQLSSGEWVRGAEPALEGGLELLLAEG